MRAGREDESRVVREAYVRVTTGVALKAREAWRTIALEGAILYICVWLFWYV